LGAKFAAGLGRGGAEYVRVGHESFFIHVVSGIPANTFVNLTWFRATIPLREQLGIGLEYDLYTARHEYKSLPRIDSRNPEIRLSFAWQLY